MPTVLPASFTRQRRKIVLATTAMALTLLGPIGCDRNAAKPPPPKPPEVFTSEPVIKEVTDYEEFVGQTTAAQTVEIRARVNGYLEKINFKDGDEVRENTVLFEIDPRQYDADLARTEASLAQAEAHAKRLSADYARAASLKGREVLSRQEYDQVTGDYSEANAAVGMAKAARALAKLNESYTKVTAPISGRLSRRMVDRGNLIKADETMLTTIVSLDPIYVYFDVDERTLLRLRRLLAEGKIKSRSEANRILIYAGLADEFAGDPPEQAFPHEGNINFSENRLEQSTGTLRIRAEIPNPEPRVLSPGIFMRVKLPIGTPHQALLVPEQALGTDQGNKFLYVVTDGKIPIKDPKTGKDTGKFRAGKVVEYRKVRVGSLHFGLRVVESNLKPGEKFVLTGLQRVRPGAEVDPKPSATPPPTVPGDVKPAAIRLPTGG
ncbi:MAG: family efflux transporter, subunit [Planctomycetota bacterium]|nr:family efflux transporter, subunit [Planctomycetota bacterium]